MYLFFSDVLDNGAKYVWKHNVWLTVLTVTEDKNENGWDE